MEPRFGVHAAERTDVAGREGWTVVWKAAIADRPITLDTIYLDTTYRELIEPRLGQLWTREEIWSLT